MPDITSIGHAVFMAVQGSVSVGVGYQQLGSPYTTLQETWQKLHDIKDYLDAVSRGQRRRIEAAANDGRCKSLTDLEDSFRDLWDEHSALIQEYDQSSLIKRHFTRGIRGRVSNLEAEVKALLNDTRTTTRAHSLNILLPPLPSSNDQGNDSTTNSPISPSLQNSGADREAIETAAV